MYTDWEAQFIYICCNPVINTNKVSPIPLTLLPQKRNSVIFVLSTEVLSFFGCLPVNAVFFSIWLIMLVCFGSHLVDCLFFNLSLPLRVAWVSLPRISYCYLSILLKWCGYRFDIQNPAWSSCAQICLHSVVFDLILHEMDFLFEQLQCPNNFKKGDILYDSTDKPPLSPHPDWKNGSLNIA